MPPAWIVLLSLALFVLCAVVFSSFINQSVNSSPRTQRVKAQTASLLHNYETCNCFTHNATNSTKECCERIIWRTHKFGTILLGDLFYEFRRASSIVTRPTPKDPNYALPDTARNDYRHVLVTRNWFEAIVSGYLYHAAGYECWIEPKGRNHHHSKHYDMQVEYHNKRWDSYLTYHHNNSNSSFLLPPRQNRSLCNFLQEESEEVGVRVVIDLALSRWYKGVVAYHKKAMNSSSSSSRSLFLCYEDLVDPGQQEDIFYRILQHMFPGQQQLRDNYSLPPQMRHALQEQQQNNHSSGGVYAGGHATTRDTVVRSRLRELVQRLDQHHVFGNTIATSNAVFGCGGTK